jgi:hypothetical protein
MALSITQNPAQINLAQSPTVFTQYESTAALRASSSFQYVAELYYWTGSLTESGSTANYTLQKYPNPNGRGIFDVSRVLASTFTDLRAEDSSSVKHFAIDAYVQYKNNPTGSFITGSHVRSNTYQAIDGYKIFQETIASQPSDNSTFWPLMTDGPASQSFFDGNYGRLSVWRGADEDATYAIYSSSNVGEDQSVVLPSTTSNSSGSVVTIPWLPTEPDFPLSTTEDSYTIFLISGSNQNDINARVTDNITITKECTKKYPNIRIKWKNRYGQFDYFNFNLVSKQSMKTQRSRYQPQIGSWSGNSLSYQKYESSIQNYITDSTLKLSVNTDYISEDYNDIFKQLMSSEEIYWVYDEANDYVRPLALDTSQFNIKTHVVDKLIQYSFEFTQGQGYKLIF